MQLSTTKLFTTQSSCCSWEYTNFSKEVSYLNINGLEKFDDIKFGKVLTKLYAKIYSMEELKYLPPKFSYAMKDLTSFLGIFEISEEEIR